MHFKNQAVQVRSLLCGAARGLGLIVDRMTAASDAFALIGGPLYPLYSQMVPLPKKAHAAVTNVMNKFLSTSISRISSRIAQFILVSRSPNNALSWPRKYHKLTSALKSERLRISQREMVGAQQHLIYRMLKIAELVLGLLKKHNDQDKIKMHCE